MHSYDNEYTQPGYESNYEFNPEYESDFENENFENESENEYGSNAEYNMEESYESPNDYEDESNEWENEIRVHDHRTGARPTYGYRPPASRTVVVPTRPGSSFYKPSVYQNYQRPYRQPSNYRTGSSGYYRPAGSSYRAPYRRWAYNNNYYNKTNPWHRWHHRYPQSSPGYGINNVDQSSQYSQNTDTGTQPSSGVAGGVPNYILESIKNLSQQVSATNANVQAMQQSMAGAGNQGNNIPPPPPPDNSPMGTVPPNVGQPPAPDHEMEDYEYDMENEMMNYGNSSNELNEMEMAAELLATNNEMELDHFLGGLLGGSGPLKNLLKGIVKKVLPVAGAAAGTFFGGPLGAQVGEKIGSAASGMFELELEGLSNEDQEFEVAKAVVRLAKDAADELANTPPTGDPNDDAKNALIQSATQHAPGLLVRKHHHHHGGGQSHGGYWHRRGHKIIIENAF